MAKRGRLSRHEIYYIQRNPDGLTLQEMASTLDRTETQVEKHFNENPDKTKIQPPPQGQAGKLMGKKKGSVVMTPQASSVGDDFRQTRPLGGSRKCEKSIHQPLGDNESM